MRILTRACVLSLLASLLVYGQEPPQTATTGTLLRPLPKIIQGPVVLGAGNNWAVISWTTNAAGRAASIIYAGTDKNNLRPIAQTPEPVKLSDLPSYQEQ